MIRMSDIPGYRIPLTIATATVAMGAGATHSLVRVPDAWTLVSAHFVPDGALTGDDTDTKIVALRNEGTDGTGTGVVAAADTFGTGDDLVAQTPRAFTLTATAADLEFTAGQVLSAVITEAGTGIAWPSGVWQTYWRFTSGS